MFTSPAKKSCVWMFAVICFFLLAGSATAQTYGTDTDNPTVTVATIELVQVSAPSATLSITDAVAVAGQDQMSVSDESTNILWGVNSWGAAGKKITASTDLAAPIFTLNLVAVSIQQTPSTPASPVPTTAASEFTLSTGWNDLLYGIGRSSGAATLRYTGIALASQGTGTDVHTITFTIANQ